MISKNLSKKTLIEENILILGGGYIGTNVFEYIKKNISPQYNVTLVTRKELDYGDTSKFSKYLLNNDIHTVVNCSGFTGRPNVDEAELKKEECWNLNVLIPLKVANVCNHLAANLIHISSGCIYNDYTKNYTEEDAPNFGLFHNSSFYSKSKHAFELHSKDKNLKILRIRMPLCLDLTNPRNYLTKLMNYPNLINYYNSKTFIPELCQFVEALIVNQTLSWYGQDIYNVVNPNPYNTMRVVDHLNQMNEGNWPKLAPNWVDMDDLTITAPRSNCILDNSKADVIFKLHTEYEVMNMICNYHNGIEAL